MWAINLERKNLHVLLYQENSWSSDCHMSSALKQFSGGYTLIKMISRWKLLWGGHQ